MSNSSANFVKDVLSTKIEESNDKEDHLFFIHHDKNRPDQFNRSDQTRTVDPLMSEWDDENVIVIDLTEERLTSASTLDDADESENFEIDERQNGLESSFASQDISLIEERVVENVVENDGGREEEVKDKKRRSFTEEVLEFRSSSEETTKDERPSSSASSNSSASSQVSALDNDFHCKELATKKKIEVKKVELKNGKEMKMRRPMFSSKSIDKETSSSLRRSQLSKSKAVSVDVRRSKEDNQFDVLARLHQEIYQNSKLKSEQNNNNNGNSNNNGNGQAEIENVLQTRKDAEEIVQLAPVKLRPWEKKIAKSEFLGGREVTYIRPRNHNFFGTDPDGDFGSPDRSNVTSGVSESSSAGATPMSAKENNLQRITTSKRPASKSLSSSRDGIGSAPLSVFTGYREHSAPEEPLLRRSLDRQSHPHLVYRGIMNRRLPDFENRDFLFSALKARSSDYLDRTDNSVSSRGRTRSSANGTPPTRSGPGQDRDKMTRIDKNLFLGTIEAATDVILLGSNAITHIVSVDSVPLPRKISAMLPRISFMHMQVSDLPDEDILSHLGEAIEFMDSAISRGGSVLVHCFRGRSRSATVVIAYLMYKHHYKLEKAFFKVKSKRDCINPHLGFLAQLKLFEAMEYTIDLNNVQYKMFRLYCASERMRKAKILFRDSLDKVLDVDPAGGLPGSAEAAAAAASKSRYPMIYKCRKCRRTLATAFNMLPHVRGETPNWMDEKWARLSEEDVIDDASSPAGLDLCSQSVFITPVGWMEAEIKQNLSGRLYCPNCQVRVGNYSWILGDLCKGCGATVLPAFQLDMTEIIFRTHNRYLQSGYMARGPILV